MNDTYYTQQPRFGPPLTPMVKYLLISNVVIHLVLLFLRFFFPNIFGVIFMNLILDPGACLFEGKVWQLLTYAFIHSPQSPFHIGFNMLALWMFGAELETYWGRRPFLLFYLLCALGGGIAILLSFFLFSQNQVTLGASGAVLGLITAFGMVFSERRILLLIPPVPIKGKWLVLVVIGMDILFFLHGSGISLAAHLGGALTGYLYMKSRFRFSPSATFRVRGLTFRQHLKRWRTRRHLKVIVKNYDEQNGESGESSYKDGPTYH